MVLLLRRRYKSNSAGALPIPVKSSQILNLIFFILLFITFRLWQLCIIYHEDKVQEALRPQQKVFVQPANRGGIYDRYGLPLAVNKIQYQAGVFYSPIRQISTLKWTRDKKGKKTKHYPRRNYIEELSKKLGDILHLDAARVEDLIHAKASIRYDTPFILKEGITEEQYYRLKALEGDWPGIYAGISSQRHYPQQKVAASIVGYMGAINRNEYESFLSECRSLEEFLNEWQQGYFPPLPKGIKTVAEVRTRLRELKEKSYSIYDWVGKAGIEASFDEALRGYSGKEFFYSDAKGKFLKPLPLSQKSLSGKRLSLTISSELQQYAEELLAENEKLRRSIYINPMDGRITYQKEPWIKGGAIVALDPANGEVLALASFPRYDPNDFIPLGNEEQKQVSQKNISQWFEGEEFIADLWDGRNVLTKEVYDSRLRKIVEDEFPLTWELYLNFILPVDSPVLEALLHVKTVKQAILVQNAFASIYQMSGVRHPFHVLKTIYKDSKYVSYPKGPVPTRIANTIEKNLKESAIEFNQNKKILDSALSKLESNYDQLLTLDLCRLCVNSEDVDEKIMPFLDQISLSEHRQMEQAYVAIEEAAKKMSKELFRKYHFKNWRKNHQKSFLKEKRKQEAAQRNYPKSYIDYLDQEEKEQFAFFWQSHKDAFVKSLLTAKVEFDSSPTLIPYFNHFALWGKEIKLGAHSSISWFDSYKKLESLLQKGSEEEVCEYFKLFRKFEDLDRPLYGKYHKIRSKKPTELDLAKSFYPEHGYSYARSYAFSQSTPQGSHFKLVTAYEALRQKHQQNPNISEQELNPLTIIDDFRPSQQDAQKWDLGYFMSGAPIPQMYKGGRLPRARRRAIGKIDLKDALAVSSNCYFALLASDVLKHPEDLNRAASLFSYGAKTGIDLPNEISGRLPKDLSHNLTGLYSYSIGQHTLVVTPLQSTVMLTAIANGGIVFKPQIVKDIQGVKLKQFNAALLQKEEYDFKTTLNYLGIDFPLFTCKERGEFKFNERYQLEIHRQIEMPPKVKNYLFKSLYEIVHGKLGSANPSRIRNYSPIHPCNQAYQELKNQIIGKTSSAEIREAIDLDLQRGVNTYKHTWFGGIVFEEDVTENHWPKPELVVIVYLRYSDFGREAAPIVAALAKRWREIKKKNNE